MYFLLRRKKDLNGRVLNVVRRTGRPRPDRAPSWRENKSAPSPAVRQISVFLWAGINRQPRAALGPAKRGRGPSRLSAGGAAPLCGGDGSEKAQNIHFRLSVTSGICATIKAAELCAKDRQGRRLPPHGSPKSHRPKSMTQKRPPRPIRTLPVRPSPCRDLCGRPRSSARLVPSVTRYRRSRDRLSSTDFCTQPSALVRRPTEVDNAVSRPCPRPCRAREAARQAPTERPARSRKAQRPTAVH